MARTTGELTEQELNFGWLVTSRFIVKRTPDEDASMGLVCFAVEPLRAMCHNNIEGTEQHCSFLASDKMLEGCIIFVVGMIHRNHRKPKVPKAQKPQAESPHGLDPKP